MSEFNEAPASVSIKAYSPGGFDVMVTIRDGDTSTLMPRMAKALEWLRAQGYKPTRNGASSATNGSAPTCKYHGAMKRSKKFNGWYCPSKLGDGSYCKEKVLD